MWSRILWSVFLISIVSQIFSVSSSYFLPKPLTLLGKNKIFYVRQVPGDGGCLFHSLATCLDFLIHHSHREFDDKLRNLSLQLRQLAVDILEQNNTLVIEDGVNVTTAEILSHVSESYNLSPSKYCNLMRLEHTWGGGPEIVALCNHFRCPIHVYNLATKGRFWWKTFVLTENACFGSPTFDKKAEPIHLLSVDGRFPNISPGQQKAIGNHFMSLFPVKATCVAHDSDHLPPSRFKTLLNSCRSRFLSQYEENDTDRRELLVPPSAERRKYLFLKFPRWKLSP